ncbi:hypothetical protein ACYSUO_10105 [Streptomyces sp. UC4497]
MAEDVIKRLNYFDHQFLRAKDFTDEQSYAIDRRRRHNRDLHTPGVGGGLAVTMNQNSADTVTVEHGWLVDGKGREAVLPTPGREVKITSPPADGSVELYASYDEDRTDPSVDPGIAGKETRVTEKMVIDRPGAGGPSTDAVHLADIVFTGGRISSVTDKRVYAGTGTANLVDGSVTSPKLAQGAVEVDKLANEAVTSPKLAQGAVEVDKLANEAVTSPKLAEADGSAVGDPRVGAGVKTAHLHDFAVTSDKLADFAVHQKKIAEKSVSIRELKVGTPIAATVTVPAGGEERVPPLAVVALAGFCLAHIAMILPKPIEVPPPLPGGPPVQAPRPLPPIEILEEFAVDFRLVNAPGFPPKRQIIAVPHRQWRVRNTGARDVDIEYRIYPLEEQ